MRRFVPEEEGPDNGFLFVIAESISYFDHVVFKLSFGLVKLLDYFSQFAFNDWNKQQQMRSPAPSGQGYVYSWHFVSSWRSKEILRFRSSWASKVHFRPLTWDGPVGDWWRSGSITTRTRLDLMAHLWMETNVIFATKFSLSDTAKDNDHRLRMAHFCLLLTIKRSNEEIIRKNRHCLYSHKNGKRSERELI